MNKAQTPLMRRAYRRVVPRSVRRLVHPPNPVSLLRRTVAHLTDDNLKNMAERLRRLRGAYSGNRCFVMGNGPSLNKNGPGPFKK